MLTDLLGVGQHISCIREKCLVIEVGDELDAEFVAEIKCVIRCRATVHQAVGHLDGKRLNIR